MKNAENYEYIEFICRFCGVKVTRKVKTHKPIPGFCPGRPRNPDGTFQPHIWLINRRF